VTKLPSLTQQSRWPALPHTKNTLACPPSHNNHTGLPSLTQQSRWPALSHTTITLACPPSHNNYAGLSSLTQQSRRHPDLSHTTNTLARYWWTKAPSNPLLVKGLEQGFLKANNSNEIKWAVMWANQATFSLRALSCFKNKLMKVNTLYKIFLIIIST
jgi:hypothetical protein